MFIKRKSKQNEDSKPSSGQFFKQTVQQKLKMGEANDKYEQEADRVADKVVNQSNVDGVQKKEGEEELQQKPIANEVTPLVQKMESSEEEPVQMMQEEESVQKMDEEESVQKKEASSGTASPSIESRLNQSKGKGKQMDGGIKSEMESGFGNDFSKVNIHTDENAAQMSQDLGAQAFAHGNDVYFNKGKYNPESSKGKHLLAHELTHTIQQSGTVQKKPDNTKATNKKKTTVKLEFNAFIPNSLSGQHFDGTRAWKWEPGQIWGTKLYSSDDRDYHETGTSRIWQNGTMTFEGDTLMNRTNSQGVGESHQADAVKNSTGKVIGYKNMVTKKAPDNGKVTKIDENSKKGFNFLGQASYPFSSVAPGIDFNMTAKVTITKVGEDLQAFVSFNGTRNSFPAYEAVVTINGKRNTIYNYSVSSSAGPGVWNLNTWKTISASSMYKL